MRAKYVNFERGLDPIKSMGIGIEVYYKKIDKILDYCYSEFYEGADSAIENIGNADLNIIDADANNLLDQFKFVTNNEELANNRLKQREEELGFVRLQVSEDKKTITLFLKPLNKQNFTDGGGKREFGYSYKEYLDCFELTTQEKKILLSGGDPWE